jgi:hypothetical protein
MDALAETERKKKAGRRLQGNQGRRPGAEEDLPVLIEHCIIVCNHCKVLLRNMDLGEKILQYFRRGQTKL